jgi:hypothetical protein
VNFFLHLKGPFQADREQSVVSHFTVLFSSYNCKKFNSTDPGISKPGQKFVMAELSLLISQAKANERRHRILAEWRGMN